MTIFHCPVCGDLIPVEATTAPGRLIFSEMSFADVHAHIWEHEAEAPS